MIAYDEEVLEDAEPSHVDSHSQPHSVNEPPCTGGGFGGEWDVRKEQRWVVMFYAVLLVLFSSFQLVYHNHNMSLFTLNSGEHSDKTGHLGTSDKVMQPC